MSKKIRSKFVKERLPSSQEEAGITAAGGNSSQIILSVHNPTGGLLQAKQFNLQQQMHI